MKLLDPLHCKVLGKDIRLVAIIPQGKPAGWATGMELGVDCESKNTHPCVGVGANGCPLGDHQTIKNLLHTLKSNIS